MRKIAGGVAALALPLVLTTAPASAAGPGGGPGGGPGAAGPARDGWRLAAAESFDRRLDDGRVAWRPDGDGPGSPYDVDMYDNDGAYFDAVGGPAFRRQLASVKTYRKSFAFGPRGG
ncbi:hypothetical protein [Actinomadura sp. J1-007]|uniref:hypothetical protein n=1 Tax=Actinomadura sp. J1-007 TaxID=2661913 RepID=UPI001F4FD489|nr:hypothetical protein [Actinomadura sp. J1-007]